MDRREQRGVASTQKHLNRNPTAGRRQEHRQGRPVRAFGQGSRSNEETPAEQTQGSQEAQQARKPGSPARARTGTRRAGRWQAAWSKRKPKTSTGRNKKKTPTRTRAQQKNCTARFFTKPRFRAVPGVVNQGFRPGRGGKTLKITVHQLRWDSVSNTVRFYSVHGTIFFWYSAPLFCGTAQHFFWYSVPVWAGICSASVLRAAFPQRKRTRVGARAGAGEGKRKGMGMGKDSDKKQKT